jgi:hypothetical protein
MQYKTRFGGTLSHGHRERTDNKIVINPISGCPTHHIPRAEVKDNRKIQPPFKRPDIGDIRDPHGIARCTRKMPIYEIGCYGYLTAWLSCPFISAHFFGDQVILYHYPADTAKTGTDTTTLQNLANTDTPIRLAGTFKGDTDLRGKHYFILLPPFRRTTAKPSVKATF